MMQHAKSDHGLHKKSLRILVLCILMTVAYQKGLAAELQQYDTLRAQYNQKAQQVYFFVYAAGTMTAKALIMNKRGRTVRDITVYLIKGENHIQLAVKKIPPGPYILLFILADTGQTYRATFIKQ